jgi:hypothetical protein
LQPRQRRLNKTNATSLSHPSKEELPPSAQVNRAHAYPQNLIALHLELPPNQLRHLNHAALLKLRLKRNLSSQRHNLTILKRVFPAVFHSNLQFFKVFYSFSQFFAVNLQTLQTPNNKSNPKHKEQKMHKKFATLEALNKILKMATFKM